MAKHDGIDLPELTKSLIMFICMHTHVRRPLLNVNKSSNKHIGNWPALKKAHQLILQLLNILKKTGLRFEFLPVHKA